jgi:hypothetical protein
MSVFVLSACSGDKEVDDPEITCEDIDSASRSALVNEHPETSMPAAKLYTGDEHEYVKTAVGRFSEMADVDWRIISAGFGLVRPETELPAYECTFNNDDAVRRRVERFGYDPGDLTKAGRIQAVADELGIPRSIEKCLTESPDVTFVVLGEKYLLSAGSAFSSIPDTTTAFAFAPKGTRDLIGECQWVPSTETEREALGTTGMELKGRQLRNVATNITTPTELQTPENVRELSLRE